MANNPMCYAQYSIIINLMLPEQGPKGLCAVSTGFLLTDRAPQWGWVILFGTLDGFPQKIGHNSETKKDFWMGPSPISSQCRWLQMPH